MPLSVILLSCQQSDWEGKQQTWMKHVTHLVAPTITIFRREILGTMLPPVTTYLRLIKFYFWMPKCRFLGLSIASPREGSVCGWQWLTQGTAVPTVAEQEGTSLFMDHVNGVQRRSILAALHQKQISPIRYCCLWSVLLGTVSFFYKWSISYWIISQLMSHIIRQKQDFVAKTVTDQLLLYHVVWQWWKCLVMKDVQLPSTQNLSSKSKYVLASKCT